VVSEAEVLGRPVLVEWTTWTLPQEVPEREFFTDNLLVRIHFIIEMIWLTGLAPWDFELTFPGSLTSTFPGRYHPFRCRARREKLTRVSRLLPEKCQGQKLALTVLCVPNSHDSGTRFLVESRGEDTPDVFTGVPRS